MSIFDASEWFLAGRPRAPITLVNSSLSLVNQTGQATFADVDYGAPPGANRRIIACITGEEVTSGAISTPAVSCGGVSMSFVGGAGGGSGSVAIVTEVWEAIVPSGNSGDIVVTLNKTASATENFDSIGLSTFVTNLSDGAVLDAGGAQTTLSQQTRTVDNIETAGDGFLIGSAVGANQNTAFSSLAGNGSNGSLTKVVDVAIGNDHRHAIFLLDGTVASTTEDYTGNRGSFDLWAMAVASWRY